MEPIDYVRAILRRWPLIVIARAHRRGVRLPRDRSGTGTDRDQLSGHAHTSRRRDRHQPVRRHDHVRPGTGVRHHRRGPAPRRRAARVRRQSGFPRRPHDRGDGPDHGCRQVHDAGRQRRSGRAHRRRLRRRDRVVPGRTPAGRSPGARDVDAGHGRPARGRRSRISTTSCATKRRSRRAATKSTR